MKQKEMVLSYMKEFGSITALEALRDLGVFRLAARIANLKDDGVNIKTEYETAPNRYGKKTKYARYSLEG